MRTTSNPSCEVFIDGASHGNPGPAGVGAAFREGELSVGQFSHYLGETTNNVAEYLALIYALQEAAFAGYTRVTVKSDSELLVKQVSGQYKVRDERLQLLHGVAQHLITGFEQCRVDHVPRTQNRAADRLATEAVTQRRIWTIGASRRPL